MQQTRVKLVIAYNGSDYYGFERQKGLQTIQGTLEKAIKSILGQDITVTASGRTDAKVHALGQVCHFDFSGDFEVKKLQDAINFYLPRSIQVLNAEEVSSSFNARKSAKKKTYFYDFYVGDVDNPILVDRAFRVKGKLDEEKLASAARLFLGRHDLENFRCLGSSAKTTERNIFDARIEKANLCGQSGFRFFITADGFLYKTVRLIISAIIKVGENKLSLEELSDYISMKKVYKNKLPAPPSGLYLFEVEY